MYVTYNYIFDMIPTFGFVEIFKYDEHKIKCKLGRHFKNMFHN